MFRGMLPICASPFTDVVQPPLSCRPSVRALSDLAADLRHGHTNVTQDMVIAAANFVDREMRTARSRAGAVLPGLPVPVAGTVPGAAGGLGRDGDTITGLALLTDAVRQFAGLYARVVCSVSPCLRQLTLRSIR